MIERFVKSIDPTIEVEYEDEFSVIIEDKVIYIGINTDPLGDKLIQDFVLKRFGVVIDPFLIGLLHEIAHIKTYSPEKDFERDLLYELLWTDVSEENFIEFTEMYFSIPAEYDATEWAVNYYLKNKDKCDEFIMGLKGLK